MPRNARKYIQSNINHVIVQGIEKQHIFGEEKYKKKYMDFIINKLEEIDITFLAYCIMSNHAHFLTYSKNLEDLSKFMQKLNTSYSRFYNNENKRVGFVFRDRYYSQEILSERQLYNCLRYIHNNPVKANIVKNMSAYRYSSYNEFIEERKIITEESLKTLFGSDKNYMEQFLWIHEHCNEDDFIDLEEKESILDFIKKAEIIYGRDVEEIKKDKDLIKRFARDSRENTDVTLTELAKVLNISKSTLSRYSKK